MTSDREIDKEMAASFFLGAPKMHPYKDLKPKRTKTGGRGRTKCGLCKDIQVSIPGAVLCSPCWAANGQPKIAEARRLIAEANKKRDDDAAAASQALWGI